MLFSELDLLMVFLWRLAGRVSLETVLPSLLGKGRFAVLHYGEHLLSVRCSFFYRE